MRFNLRLIVLALFGLVFVFVTANGLLWANLNFVHRIPGGSDFYVLWKGGENFLMHGQIPYQDLSKQARIFAYGQGAAKSGPYVQRLSVPFYLFILLSPLGLIRDVSLARAVWMIFLEIGLGELVWLTYQLAHWRLGRFRLMLLVLFGIAWAPALLTVFSGSLIIFQALLLFGGLRALEFEADELAGAMIAFACFNFELVGPLLVLIFLWVGSMKRWRVVAGFVMVSAVLIIISLIFNYNWLLPFAVALLANFRENANPSTYSLLGSWLPGVGLRLAQGLTLLVALMLIAEWRNAREKDFRWLLWTVSLTVAATPLLGLPVAPAALAISLPALLFAVSIMEQRWGVFGRWSAVSLLVLVFSGLWLAARADVGSVFTLFFPILLIVLLYWVRWWASRPTRLWVDTLSEGEA